MNQVEVVNIAASGDLGREVDIEQMAADADIAETNYDPRVNSLILRFEKDTSRLVFVYTTGSFIVRGGDSFDQLDETYQRFLDLLEGLGIDADPDLQVKNVVCTGDLRQSVDLNELAIRLGMESTEYEPEQFPGLVYRPSESPCVLLVFSTGKVVITGGKQLEDAQDAFRCLRDEIAGNGEETSSFLNE